MNSDSVDLIYLDPPFNSNKSFSAPIGSKAAGASFDDAWTLNDVDFIEWDLLSEKYEVVGDKLKAVLHTAKLTHGDSMFSYLLFMSTRIYECWRILKPTGSLYLHCDPYASHYLKLMLDAVFSKKYSRNEIIWCYPPTGKSPKKFFPRKHDVILFYSKTDDNFYKQPYTEMTESTKQAYSAVDKDGRLYSKAHGGITYLDEQKGRPVPSWWDDIGSGSHMPQKERTGYPTQKPLKLLNRIIRTSSREGDIIFDPFCGCATTLVAADRLMNRQWIGIDISPKAIELVKLRIKDDGGMFGEINHATKPPVRTDLGAELTPKEKKDYKKVLFGQQEGKCKTCKLEIHMKNLELDRIVPGTKGGTYHKENIHLICGNCNRRKNSKDLEAFLQELSTSQVPTS